MGGSEEEAVNGSLRNLSQDQQSDVRGPQLGRISIVAWSLEDICQAGVPYRHSFDLKEERPLYFPFRRTPSKHNDFVKSEIEGMLKARFIKPAESPRAFAVVISTKSDGPPRFCVDYHALNGRIKRLPLYDAGNK